MPAAALITTYRLVTRVAKQRPQASQKTTHHPTGALVATHRPGVATDDHDTPASAGSRSPRNSIASDLGQFVRAKEQSMSRFLPFAVVLLVVLFLISSTSSLLAQDLHTILSNCRAEVHNFCSNAKHDAEAITQCLLSQQDKLSASCKVIFPKR
jgi:hypothetical protein